MKNKFSAICLVVLFSMVATAQENNPIVTAVPVLSIAPDARGGGMGDVGVATSPDISSQYWNPAKYVFMESNAGVSISYTPWLRKLVEDIDLAYLSGYWKLDKRQVASVSLRYFSLGDITLMDAFGYPQGSSHPNELAIDAAYSLLLSERLSGSVAFRYIRSDLGSGIAQQEVYPGSAVAADVSAYYKMPVTLQNIDGILAFGANISNIGSKISYDKKVTSNFLPTNMRLGTSFDYPIDQYNRISASADINKLLVPTPRLNPTIEDLQAYNDMSPLEGIFKSFGDAPGGFAEEMREISWSLGAEYAYNNQLFVRGGYYNESRYKGNRKYFTAGFGFKLNVFQLDAAYVISTSQTNPLDRTLRVTLGFDIFGMKDLLK